LREIWANMIRLGQNQNLVSPKTSDLLKHPIPKSSFQNKIRFSG